MRSRAFGGQLLGVNLDNFFYDAALDDSKYGSGKGIAYTYEYSFSSRHYSWGVNGDGVS